MSYADKATQKMKKYFKTVSENPILLTFSVWESPFCQKSQYCSTEIIQAIEGVVFLSLFLHTSTSGKKSFNTKRERIGYVT
jgi:hypothetical protein